MDPADSRYELNFTANGDIEESRLSNTQVKTNAVAQSCFSCLLCCCSLSDPPDSLEEILCRILKGNPHLKEELEKGEAVKLSRKQFGAGMFTSGLAASIELVPIVESGKVTRIEVQEKVHGHKVGEGLDKVAKLRWRTNLMFTFDEQLGDPVFTRGSVGPVRYIALRPKRQGSGRVKDLSKEIENLEEIERIGSPYLMGGRAFRCYDPSGRCLKTKILVPFAERGELFDHYFGKEFLKEGLLPEQVSLIAKQLISGINDLHKGGFAHRDLKPQNVLVKENGDISICDFGVMCEQELRTEYVGTDSYAAPEITKNGNEYDPQKADIFSLGVMLHELFRGGRKSNITADQWGRLRPKEGVDRTVRNLYPGIPRREEPEYSKKRDLILRNAGSSEERKKLLCDMMIFDMMDVNPECRPSILEVKELFD